MANYKCKMCGAPLEVNEGQTVAVCSFCGSKQTVANADDERKENLYNRANALRANCEFDKAILAYQSILSIFPDEPEAHWGLCLCKYGIEYIDDPVTKAKKPTIHRMSFESILKDSDYITALAYADVIAKEEYQVEAKEIADIQKNILSISQKEEPFDIFICYKESDEKGKRTPDSVMAQEIYDQLTNKEYKVFFSRVSLENKLGTMYEPYIFAALNSAKIMLVIGTKKEYFDAVWVKNEWSRFIDLMQTRPDHYLIPCYKNMDAYEMPEQFLSFQAQDLSKLGFMQDLIRGIDKIMGKNNVAPKSETKIIQTDVNVDALLKRAEILISDGDYEKADGLLERVLDNDPTNSQAYLLKLVIELELNSIDELKNEEDTLEDYSNFQKALKFASEEQRKKINSINEFINNRNEEERLSELYDTAMEYKDNGEFLDAVKAFKNLAGFRDSNQQAAECIKLYNEGTYESAIVSKEDKDYDDAIELFSQIIDFKDSKEQIEICEQLKKSEMYDDAISLKQDGHFNQAIDILEKIIDYKDADYQIKECIQLKIDAQKETIYKSCLFDREINPSLDLLKLKKSCKSLSTILGYKDSEQLLVKYEGIIKDYEVKLAKQKEEQKRIKAIRKKKIKKISIISGITATIFAGIMLLVFLFLIPQSRQNNIQSLLNQKRYDEAYSLIEENGEYGDTKNLLEMYKAGKAFETLDYESGINYIYNIGGTIDVTYDANGGTLSKDHETIKSLKHIDNDPIEKEGYTFYGWKQVDYSIDSKNHYATVNLRAEYEMITYELSFDLDGGAYPETLPSNYNITESIALANPTKTGYTFIGWTGLNETTPTINYILPEGSIGNKHYKANWEANNYTINIDLNTGSMNKTSFKVTYDSEYILTEPTKVGYNFVGYVDENGDAFSSTGIYKFDKDITLTAQWRAKTDILYRVNYYFENIDNEVFSLNSYDNMYGTADKTIVVQAKHIEGFTLIEDSKTITINPDGSSVVDFYYSRNTYSLSFVTNGGNSVSDITLKYEEKLPSNIRTTRDGYTFDGWYQEVGQENKFIKMPAYDMNVYAYYSEETRAMYFDVSYDSGKATIIKGKNLSGNITIPLYINDNLVTVIGNEAFSNCSLLISITIPSNITIIGKNAFQSCTSLVSMTISSSVIAIGESAFSNCYLLKNIYYHGTIKDWCNIKFSDLYSTPMYYAKHFYTINSNNKYEAVTNIEIPDTVTRIGDYQFHGFNNVIGITIPSSATTIGYNAFSKCSLLTSITLPSSVTTIGYDAFSGCTSLENVYYEGTIEDWCNITFSNEYSTPMYYANHLYMLNSNNEYEEVTSIEIPDTIASIGKYQFYGFNNVTSITIPSSVTTIGSYAFRKCTSLTIYCEATSQPSGWNSDWVDSSCKVYWNASGQITIGGLVYTYNRFNNIATIVGYTNSLPSEVEILETIKANEKTYSVSIIRDNAFENCTSLTSIIIPSSVETIGHGAFSGCSSLKKISLPFVGGSKDDNAYLGYIFGATSYNYNSSYVPSSLKEVVILEGCTSIRDNAFENCTSLTSIIIPSSVVAIGNNAFYNCSSLTNVYYEGTIEDWCNITFSSPASTPMYYANHFYMLNSNDEYEEVTNIEVPDIVSSVGKYQFYGFNNVTNIKLPSSVTTIGEHSFYNCNSLTSITIPNSITSIGEFAFYNCNSLTNITIPSSVTKIGSHTFSNCSSLAIYCEATSIPSGWGSCWNNSGRPVYYGITKDNKIEKDGIIYVIKNNEAIVTRYVGNATNVTITSTIELNGRTYNVTTIGEYSFSNCILLVSITISSSVTYIGNNAFNNCSLLTDITIPSSVITIGTYTFAYCISLARITIPNNVVNIGDNAFYKCTSLIIYCEAVTKPSSWSSSWNGNAGVIWGCK